MKKLYFKSRMELFRLERHQLQAYLPAEGVQIVAITKENLWQLKAFGKSRMHNAMSRFGGGDVGVLALLDGKAVGYGWIRHRGSHDHYYRIGKDVAYLGGFFVSEEARGRGIYPAMITHLIQNEDRCDVFFISAHSHNKASLRGLQKVGFRHIEEIIFRRACKVTLNKRMLTKELGSL